MEDMYNHQSEVKDDAKNKYMQFDKPFPQDDPSPVSRKVLRCF